MGSVVEGGGAGGGGSGGKVVMGIFVLVSVIGRAWLWGKTSLHRSFLLQQGFTKWIFAHCIIAPLEPFHPPTHRPPEGSSSAEELGAGPAGTAASPGAASQQQPGPATLFEHHQQQQDSEEASMAAALLLEEELESRWSQPARGARCAGALLDVSAHIVNTEACKK